VERERKERTPRKEIKRSLKLTLKEDDKAW